jgi:hypothetical protein
MTINNDKSRGSEGIGSPQATQNWPIQGANGPEAHGKQGVKGSQAGAQGDRGAQQQQEDART